MELLLKTKILGVSILVLRIWIIVDMCFIVALKLVQKVIYGTTTTF